MLTMKRIALVLTVLVVGSWAAVSVAVEMEGAYVLEDLGGAGPVKALVLYHPSRDARFSDDLSFALAQGLKDAGFKVERATLTRSTPPRPTGYTFIGVVSNTYYWTPDLPTLHYLQRARLDGISVLGAHRWSRLDRSIPKGPASGPSRDGRECTAHARLLAMAPER
jgi:hypothetical protein